jgi:hypothetical protein
MHPNPAPTMRLVRSSAKAYHQFALSRSMPESRNNARARIRNTGVVPMKPRGRPYVSRRRSERHRARQQENCYPNIFYFTTYLILPFEYS